MLDFDKHMELKYQIENELDKKTPQKEILEDFIIQGYKKDDVLDMIEEVKADQAIPNAETQTLPSATSIEGL